MAPEEWAMLGAIGAAMGYVIPVTLTGLLAAWRLLQEHDYVRAEIARRIDGARYVQRLQGG